MPELFGDAIIDVLKKKADIGSVKNTVYGRMAETDRGGRVCLDNLKQFLSGKLPWFMPLPQSVVV